LTTEKKHDQVAPIGMVPRPGKPSEHLVCVDPTGARLSKRDAIALSYLTRSGNPKVVAKGTGVLAEEMIRKAKEHGVFVYESRELLLALSGINLDQEIDKNLYHAISSLLLWIDEAETHASAAMTALPQAD